MGEKVVRVGERGNSGGNVGECMVKKVITHSRL